MSRSYKKGLQVYSTDEISSREIGIIIIIIF